jgi:hypothetical protein
MSRPDSDDIMQQTAVADLQDSVAGALREHLSVCDELLGLAKREADALRQAGQFPAAALQAERKKLLARLESSSRALASNCGRWSQSREMGSDTPAEIARLARTSLDTIMRVLVMGRENEQSLLRRGLLPARSLPCVEQSQPTYVARTYQRHVRD